MVTIESIIDRPEAVPVVAAWIYEQWSFLSPDMSIEAWTEFIQARISFNDGQSVLYVAMDGNTPVGCLAMYSEDPATSIDDIGPWVGAFYVENKYRGTNVARKLANTTLDAAREMDLITVYAVVTDPKLIKIAHRIGWKTIKEEFYKGRDSTIISLDL
ncbi:MAG: GNAT family N-acetyltransferase [Anaerohalosphaera sp.]|nr:GNAT family N-acetyltransferase [Anaerohalosphaera sp.]